MQPSEDGRRIDEHGQHGVQPVGMTPQARAPREQAQERPFEQPGQGEGAEAGRQGGQESLGKAVVGRHREVEQPDEGRHRDEDEGGHGAAGSVRRRSAGATNASPRRGLSSAA